MKNDGLTPWISELKIPDYRIELYDSKSNKMLADLSNIAISDLTIEKERNQPDFGDVTIEYTQFIKKMERTSTWSQNVLEPYLTNVVIKRDFKPLTGGYLEHVSLKLSQVGKEELQVKFSGFGEMLNKRFIEVGYGGMTYAQMARQIVTDAQHEKNYIENYAFETSEDWFDGWTYSSGEEPTRSNPRLWGGGIYILSGQGIRYNFPDKMESNHGDLFFSFYSKHSGTYRIDLIDSNNSTIRSVSGSVSGESFVKNSITIPNTSQEVYGIRFNVLSGNLDLSEFQLYKKPSPGDEYDLGIRFGDYYPDVNWPATRTRHYHQQNAKDALYNLSKLAENPEENFEYNFSWDRKFNLYEYEGNPAVVKTITYPGDIQTIEIERGIEEVYNTNYGSAQEEQSTSTSDGVSSVVKWATLAQDKSSINKYGVLAKYSSYSGVKNQQDLDNAAKADLNIHNDIQTVPSLLIETNKLNPSNLSIGDATGLNVLADEYFSFLNGAYRIYSYRLNITTDSVEKMEITMCQPGWPATQRMTFPKLIKQVQRDIFRIEKSK